MKHLYKKPYFYFWLTAVTIFVFTLLFYKPDDILDINIHDTYYIITYRHFGIFFSFLFILIGFIYFLLKKVELFKFLTNFHLYISIGSFIFSIIGQVYFKTFSNNSNFPLFDDLSNYITFFSIILLLFVLAQFIFLFNLIISITKFIIHRRHFKLN